MRLVAANLLTTGGPAEPLDTNLRFRGTQVEKHCDSVSTVFHCRLNQLPAHLRALETGWPLQDGIKDFSLLHPVIVAYCLDTQRPCNDYSCYDALEIVGAIAIITVDVE